MIQCMGPGQVAHLEPLHNSFRPLMLGTSKQAWMANSHSKGGENQPTKVHVLCWSFPLEHYRSASSTVWMAGEVNQEHSPCWSCCPRSGRGTRTYFGLLMYHISQSTYRHPWNTLILHIKSYCTNSPLPLYIAKGSAACHILLFCIGVS